MLADPTNTVSIEQRQAIVTSYAIFSMLKPEESQALAELMVERAFSAGENIVKQDELIDKVYMILRGQAEVRQETKEIKKNATPIALLGPKDSIGLADTGFFSSTGLRTATVTALTDVFTLEIDLNDLSQFFKKYSHVQTAMASATTQILRMQLIKQSLPFIQLSNERIRWLANKVEEISVSVGTVLFKQGEVGQNCYLIRSGQIEIFTSNENGEEKRLALLKSPTLFGEATLITGSPRNASARAYQNSDLFVLPHKYLSELIESEQNVAKMFMTLMIDRSRPKQNPAISAHPRVSEDKQSIVILKNSTTGKYLKLSAEGWFIWQQLNGKNTLHDITLKLSEEFDFFAPDVVAALISKLAKNDFISNVFILDAAPSVPAPFMSKVRNVFEAKMAFNNTDKWLSTFYNNGAKFLFSLIGKIASVILVLAGIFAFGYTAPQTLESFKLMSHIGYLLIGIIPFMIISVALHELGHALATKYYGREVRFMGVGWCWIGPVAFTDTSDMWLSDKQPRLMVNLAGIYTDVMVAGVASLATLVVTHPYLQAFFWLFALYTYIHAFRMMNPLQDLDGYYILADVLNKPRLKESAIRWIITASFFNKATLIQNRIEIFYLFVCLVYIFFTCLLTFLLQDFIMQIFGIQANYYLLFALPLFIAFLSSFSMITEIRSQST